MKRILSIVFLFLVSNSFFSQNKFLDFVVTHQNDTIYGRLRGNKIIDTKKKKHKINRKKIKSIRDNDKIYNLELLKVRDFLSKNNDSLISYYKHYKKIIDVEKYFFVRKLEKQKRKDFIILNNNDTIYGKIGRATLGGKKLVTTEGNKYYIMSSKAYREKGSFFFKRNDLRTRGNLTAPNEVELLYNGKKAKLYKQVVETTDYYNVHYYIERGGKMELIIPQRFTKMIMRIMPENKNLINKLKNREYSYYDIYLVVKYFNES